MIQLNHCLFSGICLNAEEIAVRQSSIVAAAGVMALHVGEAANRINKFLKK
ncbi:hypothetical protein [Sporosarcina sp. FA9]|uniref:hypothetical protein n=1 Tax=Sporosarcina sp. FA9 TaxID=3413030 RepID=UPI003F6583B1